MKSVGNTVVHGAMLIDENGSYGGGGFEIFYDPTLEIVTSETAVSQFQVQSWNEIIPTAF